MENLDFITIKIPTWRPKTLEGECQYSEENLDELLSKVKELLTQNSCSSVNIRHSNDSLILKFVA